MKAEALPFFVDGVWADTWPQPTDGTAPDLQTGDTTGAAGSMGRIEIARHGPHAPMPPPSLVNTTKPLPGGINMALADGHVENASLESLWNYYWNATWVVPSPRPH